MFGVLMVPLVVVMCRTSAMGAQHTAHVLIWRRHCRLTERQAAGSLGLLGCLELILWTGSLLPAPAGEEAHMRILFPCSELQNALLLLCRPGWGPSRHATAACLPRTCRCCCSARA